MFDLVDLVVLESTDSSVDIDIVTIKNACKHNHQILSYIAIGIDAN